MSRARPAYRWARNPAASATRTGLPFMGHQHTPVAAIPQSIFPPPGGVAWPATGAVHRRFCLVSRILISAGLVPMLAGDDVQHLGGPGLVPPERFQLGHRQPGRQGPRIPLAPAGDFSEPGEHLPVGAHDPFPGHRRTLSGGTAADLGDYL